MLPAMKFAFEMFAGVAIRLLTLTCEPFENTTPLGLTMTRPPLAPSVPAITEGSGALTRFRVQELGAG